MDLHEAMRRRRMVRSFSTRAVAPEQLEQVVEAALGAPTAGNTRGTVLLVLNGPEQTATYWDTTTDASWRARHQRRAEGLRRAPLVLLAYASPAVYVARYAEADKADPLLGHGPEDWPVPYWFGDAAFGVMSMLLTATAAGLGACFIGAFRGERDLACALGVPSEWRLFGAVVLGHPDGEDHRSRSLDRAPALRDRVRYGHW